MIVKRIAPAAALLALGLGAALAPAGWADEPIPGLNEQPVVVTRTVAAQVDGHDVHWWARHSRSVGAALRSSGRRLEQEKLNTSVRGRTIARLRAANRARLAVGSDGLTGAFLCIHSFEGSWTAATGNGYHGGLQMDGSFMGSYGREFLEHWGTADRWPPFVQIAVAERAYLAGRGFSPWPQTARMCGLL